MTTPGNVINKYQTSPFDLFMDLRGKEFTIIEDIKKGKDLREISENNKWGKQTVFYFIRIEHGLFQKDVKLGTLEMRNLFLTIPASITDYIGTVIEVDKLDTKTFKYKGCVAQDMNGNPLSKESTYNKMQSDTSQSPQQAQADQKELFMNKLTQDMRIAEGLDVKITAAILFKLADKVSPGNAMDLVGHAKSKGVIVEENGVFKVT